jgi:hypothetical protein
MAVRFLFFVVVEQLRITKKRDSFLDQKSPSFTNPPHLRQATPSPSPPIPEQAPLAQELGERGAK